VSLVKLIVAIVQDYDTDRLLRALTEASIGATKIASTGGFLRMGNTTVMMGVPEDRVEECVSILAGSCSTRVHQPDPVTMDAMGLLDAGSVTASALGGAVVFVLPVGRFERIEPS
jgi:uncharacterized protein YaaQ